MSCRLHSVSLRRLLLLRLHEGAETAPGCWVLAARRRLQSTAAKAVPGCRERLLRLHQAIKTPAGAAGRALCCYVGSLGTRTHWEAVDQ